jgi:hypothetical protein
MARGIAGWSLRRDGRHGAECIDDSFPASPGAGRWGEVPRSWVDRLPVGHS